MLNAGVNANVPTAKHPELDCSLVFGVNFVAHYLLVTLLLDSLNEDARVVCLASVMHHHSAACHAHDADYAESKLAMVLLARALSRGDLGRKVDGVPVNPGAANSDIWRHIWAPFQPVLRVLVAPVFLTTDQACASSVAAAALPLGTRRGRAEPLYLAPYWVPRRGFRAAFEYVGYFVGSGAAFARVPRGERLARGGGGVGTRCRGCSRMWMRLADSRPRDPVRAHPAPGAAPRRAVREHRNKTGFGSIANCSRLRRLAFVSLKNAFVTDLAATVLLNTPEPDGTTTKPQLGLQSAAADGGCTRLPPRPHGSSAAPRPEPHVHV